MKQVKHVLSYRKGHPNPQKFRENYLSLNGEWKFVFDEDDAGLLKGYQHQFPADCLTIVVPYPYQCEKSGINLPQKQCDVIWYEKELTLGHCADVMLVTFQSVDYKTTVFVNGKYVTTHEGGYDMFSADVAPFVTEGKNKITLRVEDTMSIDQIRGKQRWRKDSFTCFYTETSGIVRDVYLERLDRDHIRDFVLRADYAGKTLTAELTAPAGTEFTLTLKDADGKPVKSQTYAVTEENGAYLMQLDAVTGWSCENPYLYNVELTLARGGKTTDRILSYCGFITVACKDKRFYINGKDTYLKLVLNQGYWEDTITTPTEEEMIGDVELTLACGFNGARMHEHTPSPLNFYYMDLYGLYAWQECPSTNAYSYAAYRQYFKQFPRILHDHFSHPCILGYVLFNESWGINEVGESEEEQKLTADMYALVKQTAGGRFVISNDGWEHTLSDVITFHNYLDNYDDLKRLFDANLETVYTGGNAETVEHYKKFFAGNYRYQGQPMVFSEFAGIAFEKDDGKGWGYGKSVKTEADFLKRYGDMLRYIGERKELRGFCMTQLTDVYQEKNGLVTMDRREKVSAAELKKLHDRFE